MIPFRTTPDQAMNLAAIMVAMRDAGLDSTFVVNAAKLAHADQGVYDLMAMWLAAAEDAEEREEIVADYKDAPAEPVLKPYIKFDQLDEVAAHVVKFKRQLRDLIDQNGGVSQVAQKSGIPQPSLSRMLNSASIPRRSTLYKIANALDLPESAIVTEWSR
jgi:DNA-binding phage protein